MADDGGTFLEPADTEDDAWDRAAVYAAVLRRAGLAGRFTVGVTELPRRAASGLPGGRWRVCLFDERGEDGESLAAVFAGMT